MIKKYVFLPLFLEKYISTAKLPHSNVWNAFFSRTVLFLALKHALFRNVYLVGIFMLVRWHLYIETGSNMHGYYRCGMQELQLCLNSRQISFFVDIISLAPIGKGHMTHSYLIRIPKWLPNFILRMDLARDQIRSSMCTLNDVCWYEDFLSTIGDQAIKNME